MTKCIVIGKDSEKIKKSKIEFKFSLSAESNEFHSNPISDPSDYKNLELICRNYSAYDIIYAYNDHRDFGVLYLGHWNDGIV